MGDPAMAAARDEAERNGTIVGSDVDRVEHDLLGELAALSRPPDLVDRLARDVIDQLAEALRTCMKDLQETGVIFAEGDPPYDLLLAYDEGRL